MEMYMENIITHNDVFMCVYSICNILLYALYMLYMLHYYIVCHLTHFSPVSHFYTP